MGTFTFTLFFIFFFHVPAVILKEKKSALLWILEFVLSCAASECQNIGSTVAVHTFVTYHSQTSPHHSQRKQRWFCYWLQMLPASFTPDDGGVFSSSPGSTPALTNFRPSDRKSRNDWSYNMCRCLEDSAWMPWLSFICEVNADSAQSWWYFTTHPGKRDCCQVISENMHHHQEFERLVTKQNPTIGLTNVHE